MIQNNNLSPLPWYESIEQQNHRKPYAYGNIYPLITPSRTLLPFQFTRVNRVNKPITNVSLYTKNGTLVADITEVMKIAGLEIMAFSGYDLIIFPSRGRLGIDPDDGIYYATMTDGVQTWWSEMFTIVHNTAGFVRVEWYDAENLYYAGGHIQYEFPQRGYYRNYVYLCTTLGKPDYEFEEEGETRDGYFFPEKQLSEKTYKYVHLAPEYLCDALRIVRLSDYKTVIADGVTYGCDTFQITPKWQTQGDLASVETEFQTNTVIKKIGRGVYPTPSNNGDFNNDFNNDFKNQ